MVEGLSQTAEELGLPFGPRKKTYNSRLAQELGLWAEDKGKGDIFHKVAFKAYFADGSNLAKRSVLQQLACDAGLPKDEATQILDTRSYADRVDKDWADSKLYGITAVPTFVMGQHKLVGAQSYESLAEMVTRNAGS